jgi:hypothetical protein
MTNTSYACDRCGRPIPVGRTCLVVETGPLRPHRNAIDLCMECAAALDTWLRPIEPLSGARTGNDPSTYGAMHR